MSTIQTPFMEMEDASHYVEVVRRHYRNDHAAYKGRRNEEQQLIAEVTADESRMIIDGVMNGIMSIGGYTGPESALPEFYETDVSLVGFTWEDFRAEYSKLMVGFGIITNRLNRDGYNVPSYADLDGDSRIKAASVLLGDFLTLNALRFGVDGVGVKKTTIKTEHNFDEGTVVKTKTVKDIDKEDSAKKIMTNIAETGYRLANSQHVAAKLSPASYAKLRHQHPEIPKRQFDYILSFYTDAAAALEEQE
ncbi:MAG: hypothetical protein NTX11_01215 [Candidatus Saccharibacteria bacterium]|nr:hypothetical protein [Candidatus Saccharibacteria bacterium]